MTHNKSMPAPANNPGKADADVLLSDEPPKKHSVTLLVPTEASAAYRAVRTDDLRTCNGWVPVRRGLLVHGAGAACLFVTATAMQSGPVAGFAAGLVGAIALSPLYRGLENLVHGASHRDVFAANDNQPGKRNGRRNDAVANILFAIPVGQDVAAFRAEHLPRHHGAFGMVRDPCRVRMAQHPDVSSGGLPTLASTVKRLPRETIGFYRTVGSKPRFAGRAVLWHAIFTGLVLGWAFPPSVAALTWLAVFVPTFSFTLPLVRSVAESGEHDYSSGSDGLTVIERTFAHDGLANRIVHMFGDDLHPEHHLWPNVPQYNLRRLRERAIQAGLGKFLLRRKSLLGSVSKYD
jgi:fatty acid desaturase